MWILGLLFVLNSCIYTVTAQNYRLDNSFTPTSYKIQIALDKEFITNHKFNGTTEIAVVKNVSNAAAEVIRLHAGPDVLFNTVSLSDMKRAINVTEMTYENVTEIWTIHIPQELATATTLNVFFRYEGKLTTDNRGFYLSITETSKDVIATTQFQPTFARRAFPCFDEPSFKATFRLSLTVPNNYTALSNQPSENLTVLSNDFVRYNFADTPIMSSYLLAFVVSKFEGKDVQDAKILTMKVWSEKEVINSADFAAEVANKIIENLSNELNKAITDGHNVAYDQMGLQQLDLVAIPDFAAGAMENWGLVTFRQGKLLWNATESTLFAKENVLRVIAHEFAHSWFGDWVTTKWWDTAWLNEGFANYFEYHGIPGVKAARPFELEKQYIVNEMLPILATDGGNEALPLTNEANSVAEIQANFGGITYSKGGSILRMLRYIYGEAFLKHLNTYLYTYRNKTVVPNDLFKAFPDQRISTELLMKNWMEKPGYPVIDVTTSSTINETIITLKQKQFFYGKPKGTSPTEWYVPIWYQTVNVTSKSVSETRFVEFLKPGGNTTIKMANNTMFIINPQHMGYYRVNYEPQMWGNIAEVLKTNHSLIDVVTRTQLIDDALNLARAGQLSYDIAFDLLEYLKVENDYFAWKSAVLSFSYLHKRLEGDDIWKGIAGRINSLMERLWYDYKGFDVDEALPPVQVYAKVLALQWRCIILENEDCIEEAQELYESVQSTKESINPNVRAVVYCTALRHSKVNVTDQKNWDFLWAKYQESQVADEKEVILSVLGCTKNPAKLRGFLEYSLNPDVIRQHDAANAFKSVIDGNPDGVKVAIEFLDAKFRSIPQVYRSKAFSLLGEYLRTEKLVAQFETFVTKHQSELKEDLKVAKATINKARENIEWTQSYKETLDNYFNSGIGVYGRINYLLALVMCGIATMIQRF